MKNRRVAFILMAISFVLIGSGCVSSFVISLQADREKMQSRIVLVNDEFEEFSTVTSLFELERDELYTNILSNLYYDTLLQDDVVIKNRLSNYENMVDELSKRANKLDKLCNDVYYPDTNVNNRCNNYKSIYEQVVNYFVTDINLYNQNIAKYNEYQKGLGGSSVLNTYDTNKKYIDYNNYKEFDGKEA